MSIGFPGLVVTATIASGSSVSTQVDIGQAMNLGVILPSAWVTADISFLVCDTQYGTYQNLWVSGGEMVATATAGVAVLVPLSVAQVMPFKFIKLRSGTAAAAVNQTNGASLKVAMK